MAIPKKKRMTKKREEDKAMKRMKRLQRPWSDLPRDMLTLIAGKCGFVDQLRLRGVCKNWHSLDRVTPTHQLPWVGLVAKTTTLYDPYYKKAHKGMADDEMVSCFHLHLTRFYGTKFGWMLLTFPQDPITILRMCNPFTGEKISLPPLSLSMEYTVEAFSISSAPSSSDCTCMVFANSSHTYSFTVGTCRVNDKEWSLCEIRNKFYPERDVAYLKGAFYFVEIGGKLANFNVAQRQWSFLIGIPNFDHGPSKIASSTHLVESEGEILLTRLYDKTVGLAAFVSRLDLGKKAWVEVKSLGSRALFLGRGASFSLTLAAKDKEIADKIFTNYYIRALTVFCLKTLSNGSCTTLYGSSVQKHCYSKFWIELPY